MLELKYEIYRKLVNLLYPLLKKLEKITFYFFTCQMETYGKLQEKDRLQEEKDRLEEEKEKLANEN